MERAPGSGDQEWWWAATEQQAALLTGDFSVQGWAEHKRYLHPFGGRSRSAFADACSVDVTREEVEGWFGGRRARVLDRTLRGRSPGH